MANDLGIMLSADDVRREGTLEIVVTNPDDTFAKGSLTVTSAPPNVVLVEPAGAPARSGSFIDTIVGNDFQPTTTVTVNGKPRAVTLVPDSPSVSQRLLVSLDSTDLATVDTLSVLVTNSGTNGGSATVHFYVGYPIADSLGFPVDLTYCTLGGAMVEIASSGTAGPTRSSPGTQCNSTMTWSPDGARMAYTTTADVDVNEYFDYPVWSLNIRTPDQSSGSAIASHGGFGADAAWSPDGSRIAFAATADSMSTVFDIYVVDVDGSGLHRITTDGNNGQPSWSPDGRSIAYTHGYTIGGLGPSIYVVGADGTGARAVLSDSVGKAWPAWSPDGGRIAYSSRAGIGTVNIDGTGLAYITANGPEIGSGLVIMDVRPAWSPDGKHIAFFGCRIDWRTGCGAYVMSADGTGLQRLSQDPMTGSEFPLWRPTSP